MLRRNPLPVPFCHNKDHMDHPGTELVPSLKRKFILENTLLPKKQIP